MAEEIDDLDLSDILPTAPAKPPAGLNLDALYDDDAVDASDFLAQSGITA